MLCLPAGLGCERMCADERTHVADVVWHRGGTNGWANDGLGSIYALEMRQRKIADAILKRAYETLSLS